MPQKYVVIDAPPNIHGLTHGVTREDGTICVVLAATKHLADVCAAVFTQASAQAEADREFAARRPS